MLWKLLATLAFAFAALLAAWCLGIGPGQSVPTRLVLGFAGYSAFGAIIGLGALGQRRWAVWLSIGLGVLYLFLGGWAFATTELWEALSIPPAALMLANFGAAIVAQVLALACGVALLPRPAALPSR